jgi:hypothetical protein
MIYDQASINSKKCCPFLGLRASLPGGEKRTRLISAELVRLLIGYMSFGSENHHFNQNGRKQFSVIFASHVLSP